MCVQCVIAHVVWAWRGFVNTDWPPHPTWNTHTPPKYKTRNWDWLYPIWSGYLHKVNYLFSDAVHGHAAAFK